MREAVCGDGQLNVAGFHAQHDILKPDLFQDPGMPERAFHQALRRRSAVLRQQFLFHRSAVHADPDRDVVRLRAVRHHPDTVLPADISRVDPQLRDSVLRGADRQLIVKVDIRHQRHRAPVRQGFHRFRAGLVIHADPHQVAARVMQRADLRQGGFRIPGIGIGHALHQYRVPAAQLQLSDLYFPGHAAFLPFIRSLTETAWLHPGR